MGALAFASFPLIRTPAQPFTRSSFSRPFLAPRTLQTPHRPTRPRITPHAQNISSNDLRPGVTIDIDGQVHKVLEFLHVKPGKGAAFVRTKLKNMETGNNVDKTFRAGEPVNGATLDKATMQFSYVDGDEYVFMNMESFEEERLKEAQIGKEKTQFLYVGLDVEVLKHNSKVIDVDIPQTMSLEVTETDPGVKGNTAQGGSKPATLSTGAVIQVPLFIQIGEKIKVDTRTCQYLGRDNEGKGKK